MQPLAALTYARRAQGTAALLVPLACLCVSREAAAAAGMGGALMALHFTLLLIVARYCMRRGPQGSIAPAALLLMTKFCVMAALTAAILLVVRPHPVGFVAGLATFMVGMAGAALGHRSTPSTPQAPCAQRF